MHRFYILFLSFTILLYSDNNLSVPIEKEDYQMRNFILNKVDKVDSDMKSFIIRYLDSDFGLYAYKTNYLIPISISNCKYPYWNENGRVENPETSYKDYEAEFQISLKKPLSFNLLGLNETISFAYTQKVWWQIYAFSAPFRETNYEPEVFMTVPTTEKVDKIMGLKGFRFGFVHESNGRPLKQSRSWNRLYLGTIWQHKNLFANIRAWYRFEEELKDDDNPDILDYMGYGDISLIYIRGKSQIGLTFRNNLQSNNRGAIKVDLSLPIPYIKDSFWYAKLFSGYGESLIDYNRHVDKISLGFSFSRGLF